MRCSVPPSLAVLLLVAALPSPAAAAGKNSLWATINACDTAGHPNAVGLRASMPGNGSRQRMHMRFTAQYKHAASGNWRRVGGAGRSDWIEVGDALVRSRQAGWTFTIGQPPAGASFRLRGRVDFRWKKRKRVKDGPDRWITVKRRHRFTKKGLGGVDGGEPPGSSEARCVIR